MRSITTALRAALMASACLAGGAQATVFNFSDFSDTSNLTMVGNAAKASTADGAVLRLTPDGQYFASGAAYSSSSVQLGSTATFSPTFQFRLTHADQTPADGFAFVLAASPSGLGGGGAGIGYQGVNRSVAIEFDTFDNGAVDGNSDNHVAVATNGSGTSSTPVPVYGVQTCYDTPGSAGPAGCMANGDLWTVTIGYDGSKLSMSMVDAQKPDAFIALQDYVIDIASILGTDRAYVGFTASTGAKYENNDILNWSFADTTQLADVPEPASVALFGLGLAGLAGLRRQRRR